MSSFIIKGGRHLSGRVVVGGSKNAALPILFAALSCSGKSTIHNIPAIGDVEVVLRLLSDFGVGVERDGDSVFLDTTKAEYCRPSAGLTASLRGSTYLIGAMLARFGRTDIGAYGGCNFAPRPIDLHLYAMVQMGARREGECLYMDNPHGAIISFPKPSVGATANAMILASSIADRTELYGCAIEPHILSLAAFLRSMGADILVDDRHISIRGRELKGGEITIGGDMIEAASYHILSLLSGGDIEVCGVPSEDLFCFLSTLKASGVLCDKFDTGIRLYGKLQSKLDIVAAPYPGFPTDIAPLCAPLFAFSCGGAITDTVFPSRFGYLSALAAFGVRHELGQGSALIYPSSCHPASVTSPDLRGGMAAILLALSVEGESVIRSCELVLRGYSDLLLKLRSLGADIEFVK